MAIKKVLRVLGFSFLLLASVALPLHGQGAAVALAIDEEGSEQLHFEFAAGMIHGTAPGDWYVGERNAGREVQLVLAPREPRNDRLPPDYILVTVHAQSGVQDTRRLLERRISRSPEWKSARVMAEKDARWGPYLGMVVTLKAENAPGARESLLAFVATPWGHVEWQVCGRDGRWVEEWFRRISTNWRLGAPRELARPTSPELLAATDIIGSWKSNRGRLRLSADGRIELVWDKNRITETGTPERVMAGRYRAVDDVLLVTWSDGSQRSYRWRREGPWLLMTDHEGRVMQLRALYE